jgi:hypothetical protein
MAKKGARVKPLPRDNLVRILPPLLGELDTMLTSRVKNAGVPQQGPVRQFPCTHLAWHTEEHALWDRSLKFQGGPGPRTTS